MKFSLALVLAASASTTNAFAPPTTTTTRQFSRVVAAAADYSRYRPIILSVATEIASESTSEESSTSNDDDDEQFPPILQELREVAMKLHTREQSPKEGEAAAPAKPKEPYVPTQMDYLRFLVDSEAVYAALEEIVNGDGDGEEEEDSSSALLAVFRNSGLERTEALEKDIAWMCEEFDLERPEVGKPGRTYAEELRGMVNGPEDVPEFVCHFYNYYFAHIAGGRMIGKQMSKLLLDGETLEFYKWDENVNELKPRVKAQIEELARQWSREERDNCINATAGAFRGGGAINGYLYGGSPH